MADKKPRKPRKPRANKTESQNTNEVVEPILEATMKVTRKYFDTRFKKELQPAEEFQCSVERAKELTDAKVCEIVCLKNSL